MYTLKEQFYIPLVDLTVDVERLKKEVVSIVRPVQGDYGLTCLEEDQNSNNYNFKKYSGLRTANPNSRYLLADGKTMDNEVIHWPKPLQGTYIQELASVFANYLGLPPPRCRLSVADSRMYPTKIGYHNDNHTPYRVHIALETTPECIWKFRLAPGEKEYTLHQPISNNPVMIETADIQHDIYVPVGHKRTHIWYQFHSAPSEDFIIGLIEKARR